MRRIHISKEVYKTTARPPHRLLDYMTGLPAQAEFKSACGELGALKLHGHGPGLLHPNAFTQDDSLCPKCIEILLLGERHGAA